MNYPYIYFCCVVIATPMMVMTNLKPAIAHNFDSLVAEVQIEKLIDNCQNNSNDKNDREGFPEDSAGGGTR